MRRAVYLAVQDFGGACRLTLLQMVEILAGQASCRVFAGGEPSLCEVTLFEVAGCVCAAHFCRHPAGFKGVGEDIRPEAGEGEGQQYIVELCVRVGTTAVPGTVLPGEVGQSLFAFSVQLGADIDQATGFGHEGGKGIRCQGVDLQDLGQAIGGELTGLLLVSDRGIVDHGVEGAESVGCFSKCTGLVKAREVASEYGGNAGQLLLGMLGALGVAGVCHDGVALREKKLCSHETETIRRTGDEDACHVEPH